MHINALQPRMMQFLRPSLQGTACLIIAIASFGSFASSSPPESASAKSSGGTLAPFSSLVEANNPAAPAKSVSAPLAANALQLATATPTLTPGHPLGLPAGRDVPGQTVADEHTVLLYHFDSQTGNTVPDSALTNPHPGTLYGNASTTSSGLYAGVLQLDGSGDYVKTGNLGPLDSGTLEAYIDFSTACIDNRPGDEFPLITAGSDRGGYQDVLALRLQNTGWLQFGIFANGRWQWVDSAIRPCKYLAFGIAGMHWPYENWRFHHVAATWGPRGLELWVDGVLHGVGVWDLNYATPEIYRYNAACDPQGQGTSTIYPRCQTPVIGLLPKAYAGGLPDYDTFLIGCDSGLGRCFKGRIDELRISNIQRRWDDRDPRDFMPTLTPTVTNTPVRVTGEYAPDPYTVALYHMSAIDTTFGLEGEVDSQHGQVLGSASIVAEGRFGNSLSLDGNNSYVSLGNLWKPDNGTVEAWVKLDSADPFAVAALGLYPGFPMDDFMIGRYALAPSTNIGFGMKDTQQLRWVDSGVSANALVGAWHHIAATWGSRGMEIWIDGTLRGRNSYTGKPLSTYAYLIGCDTREECIDGLIDEVRISSIQRIFASVAPPTPKAVVGAPATVRVTVQAAPPPLSPDQQATLAAALVSPHNGSGTTGSGTAGQNAPRANSGFYSQTPPVAGTGASNAIAASAPVVSPVPSELAAIRRMRVETEFSLDGHTAALYRFNSQYGITLSDATGNYPATLFGNATILPAQGARPVLMLDGGMSYAQANGLASLRGGTIEAWVNLGSAPSAAPILTLSQGSVSVLYLGVHPDEDRSLRFGLNDRGTFRWAASQVAASSLVGAWHHVSGTWGANGLEIWIDGELEGVAPFTGGVPGPGGNTLWIGFAPGAEGMKGMISQVRVSNTQR